MPFREFISISSHSLRISINPITPSYLFLMNLLIREISYPEGIFYSSCSYTPPFDELFIQYISIYIISPSHLTIQIILSPLSASPDRPLVRHLSHPPSLPLFTPLFPLHLLLGTLTFCSTSYSSPTFIHLSFVGAHFFFPCKIALACSAIEIRSLVGSCLASGYILFWSSSS